MDIALKLKRAFATIATVALFATNASVVIAQTFTDVPTDAWYYDYVEQLVDDGVIDAGDMYRPDAALNRAELVKIVITATDGLAGYEAPATPTFDDVPTGAWYYDYVEAAVQLGIVNGYTDASGNLTGYFGPADTTNRAAATKILVNAFSVPTDLVPASDFADVTTSAWYYDYVVTAYNQSVLDGYANGFFGPADPVTRAQVAKLTVNAQNPVERVVGEGEGEGEGEGTSEGALEVSLNDETPASSTLPKAASSVDLLAFDLTAADDDVNVTQIVITRGGVGQVTDWDALYLYDGTDRLTSGRTLNSDTNTATFPISLTVAAGETKTITLKGDMAAGATASNQHYFYVASAADVTSNAQSVAGDFPTIGNTFTTGSVGVETLTVSAGSTPSQPQIGAQDVEISAFKLQAGGGNDIALHQITVTQNGSLASSKLSNLRLLRGTDEVATAEGFDAERATFVLDTPYVIAKGQTKTFYIRGDIDGGRTTDTIELYLDENTDLVAIDQQYGFGAVIDNTTAVSPFSIVGVIALNLKGGKVTVADNGPSSTQIAANATNLVLLNYGITVDRDLSVKATRVNFFAQDTAGNIPDWTASNTAVLDVAVVTPGTCAAGLYDLDTVAHNANLTAGDMIKLGSSTYARVVTNDGSTNNAGLCAYSTSDLTTLAGTETITEVNVYSYMKNVKVIDADTGNTVLGPLTYASNGTENGAGVNTTYTKDFTEDYDLVGGETRHLTLQFDTDISFVAGYQLMGGVDYTVASTIKDMDANEYVLPADVVGGFITGKGMSTTNNTLVVTRAATPSSNTFVKGQDNVETLGISFKAGDAGAITIKKLLVRAYADTAAAAAFSITGNTAANTIISSVTLYDGSDVVGESSSLDLVDTAAAGWVADSGDYYKASFEDLNLVVAAGQTKTLKAKVKLLTSMAVPHWIALDITPGDITAEDPDDNTVNASGAALGINWDTVGTVHNTEMAITTGGTLTGYSEGNPDTAVVLAGTSKVLVSKYKFTAVDESFDINKLTFMNDIGDDNGDGVFAVAEADFDIPATNNTSVVSLTLKYPDYLGVTKEITETVSGGVATFNPADMLAEPGVTKYIEVYANINTLSSGTQFLSGRMLRFGLQDTANTASTFEAVGSSSSTNVPVNAALVVNNSNTVNPFVVRVNKPVFTNATVATTKLANGTRELYGLTVTPSDSTKSVEIARMVFDVALTDADGGASLVLGIAGYQIVKNGGDPMTSAVFNLVGTKVIVTFSTTESINSATTYKLKAAVANVEDGDSIVIGLDNDVASVTGKIGGGEVRTSDNTAELIHLTVADGLFTGTTGTVGVDYLDEVGVDRNFIWSDVSANAHNFDATGVADSFDWTNGYLLKIGSLTDVTLSENN